MIHELKIKPEYFHDVVRGQKKAELRKDDRGYNVGDVLLLKEFYNGEYTGSWVSVTVTHILRGCPEYGLMDGYCILSIGRPK